MATLNKKSERSHVYSDERLAGGFGPKAAKQSAEADLRRLVMTCLLWEDNAYCNGEKIASQIAALIPQVEPKTVASIAWEARFEQKLRHVPLFICREMCKHPEHKKFVCETLKHVVHRPDELAEFLLIYWADNVDAEGKKKKTLPAQVKRGLAAAFQKFDEYQLAKWDRSGKDISLKDVLFLCHAKPQNSEQADLWERLIDNKLKTPDTWEVGLSAAKTKAEKRLVWNDLIANKKLGSLAFLKNIRNMIESELSDDIIASGLVTMKTGMLLPIDFIKAAKFAPAYLGDLEQAMFRNAAEFPKLKGRTIFVVDISGSMGQALSEKSDYSRIDAAASLAILAAEMCERITVYVTAGNDHSRIHATKQIPSYRGFALASTIVSEAPKMGGGGIFTRQCLEWIQTQEKSVPDRIIVFSDSQDCDLETSKRPQPFGKRNYIVDVSSHQKGINYAGIWTGELSGFSEKFLQFIAEIEGSDSSQSDN